MPGTITVSVLDFEGVPSSSLTLCFGKREFQSCGKGDFSFPLTSLGENLIIKLVDDKGNEISRTGLLATCVKTRLIVEKGVWDDVFSFEGGGGGHVHMRLQFVLSEEDRTRIRLMRESALKRKHEELLVNKMEYQQQQGCEELLVNKMEYQQQQGCEELLVNKMEYQQQQGCHSVVVNQMIPKDSDVKKRFFQTETSGGNLVDHKNYEAKPSNMIIKTQVEKGRSNVRKIKSLFETSITQDTEHLKKPPLLKLVSNYNISLDSSSQIIEVNAKEDSCYSGKYSIQPEPQERIGVILASESPQNAALRSKFQVKQQNIETVSEIILNDHLEKQQTSDVLVVEEREDGIYSQKVHIHGESVLNEDREDLFGLWIFPGEANHCCHRLHKSFVFTKRFCITTSTGGKRVTDEGKMIPLVPQDIREHGVPTVNGVNDGAKDVENLGGAFRQVMNAGVIMGFVTLVLLTRR